MPASACRVSVAMCTYRGSSYLRQQLESLANQTLLPWEVVVCDDNSGDETVEIVEKFALQAPFPVRVLVNQQNLGSTRNFDQAINLASGEFIALCDQDDVWYPDKLATLARALHEQPSAGGAFSDAALMDADGTSQNTLWNKHGFDRRKQDKFSAHGAIDLLLKHDIVTGATLMVRADLRHLWHPIPSSWVHDSWIAWMLAIHSRLVLVNQPLIGYRIHAEQQVGVGGGSARERLARMRKTERLRYAHVACQYEELHARVSGDPSHSELSTLLLRKIALMHRRSNLPHKDLPRIYRILADLNNYRKFARGWRSMRKDLFLS